jgi:hypothetical protein
MSSVTRHSKRWLITSRSSNSIAMEYYKPSTSTVFAYMSLHDLRTLMLTCQVKYSEQDCCDVFMQILHPSPCSLFKFASLVARRPPAATFPSSMVTTLAQTWRPMACLCTLRIKTSHRPYGMTLCTVPVMCHNILQHHVSGQHLCSFHLCMTLSMDRNIDGFMP